MSSQVLVCSSDAVFSTASLHAVNESRDSEMKSLLANLDQFLFIGSTRKGTWSELLVCSALSSSQFEVIRFDEVPVSGLQ